MRYLFWTFIVILTFIRIVTNHPTYHDGDKIRITTRVSSEPIRYENSQRINLESLVFYLPKYPEISYGDMVIVEGTVDAGKLRDPLLVKKEKSSVFSYSLRRKILTVYQSSLSGEHAALTAGVALGSKADISASFWEELKTSGTAHVVVASGFNVTLVGNFLVNFLILFFKRGKAVFFAIAGIWFYSVISGFEAPIVRAAIMGSIAFSAVALGRVNYAWIGLFLSAALMLIFRPDWYADLGFILSFVATASLMLFERKIYKKVSFLPGVIREDFSTSFAAQIGVAPILWATFGQFNLLSPLINALVIWTVVPMTVIAMIGGIVGLFAPLFGRLILFVTYPLTSWFVFVIKHAG